MNGRTPPRFVPTLTEVVHPAPASNPPALAPQVAEVAEEALVQRVLQRVDLGLDRRLREALGVVILEQTHALAPLLRARLEAVVRDAVADAVAEEIQARRRDGA